MLLNTGNPQYPKVKYTEGTNTFLISGKSFPENANEVYGPILQFLDEHDFSKKERFLLHIQLNYYNTATSKKLFEVIKFVNGKHSDGYRVEVQWDYESDDDDMFESGRYFSELVEVPFRFVEIPEIE